MCLYLSGTRGTFPPPPTYPTPPYFCAVIVAMGTLAGGSQVREIEEHLLHNDDVTKFESYM